MLIERVFYQFTDKAVVDLYKRCVASKKTALDRAAALAKKHGADTDNFRVCGCDSNKSGRRIEGFLFKKAPDPTVWTQIDRGVWRPRKNGKGKPLYEELRKIPGWTFWPVAEKVKFEEVIDGNRFYAFNHFYREYKRSVFCGMAVAHVTSQKPYKPKKSWMKQISYSEYKRRCE
jgi:hypothetical protein